jgi:hypothetical protein
MNNGMMVNTIDSLFLNCAFTPIFHRSKIPLFQCVDPLRNLRNLRIKGKQPHGKFHRPPADFRRPEKCLRV